MAGSTIRFPSSSGAGPRRRRLVRPGWPRRVALQALFGALLLAGAVFFLSNAARNLRERGIATGFAFLTEDESNFVISETAPVPVPGPDFPDVLLALAVGMLAAAAILRSRFRRDGAARPPGLTAAAVMILIVLPLIALFATDDPVRLAEYEVPSTYAMALVTGLYNTLKLSAASIVFGTLIGVVVGIGRLSPNWLVRGLATAFIEITRNIPLLLQLFFWYFAVLRTFPPVRQSIVLGEVLVLNNRGVSLPRPLAGESAWAFGAAFVLAVVLIGFFARRLLGPAGRGGGIPRWVYPAAGLGVGLPAAAWLVVGAPVGFEYPELRGFNYVGGVTLTPEFAAMLVGLVLYAGGFIAEIVRSGIEAIPRGQTEAALALGLSRGKVLRLVVLPQARRIMIPPLTSTYLGTIKDSSLGVAIGYPELISIAGTILDASGQALEILGLTIIFYMALTLLTAAGMNWYATQARLRVR